MKDQLYLCTLFDYYGQLLTERQQQYFQEYYFENLSLSEISENNNISRNAIHKTLKEAVEKLIYYEEKMNLYCKYKKIENIIKNLDSNLKNEILELI